ncbi:hypothetical protein AMTR_s00135p00094680 [Amborella trichopoda]|uniref:Pentacotripeptide-repeat region of PRORP domain-containing protein n=2 Tax=Amborella trichopoda TaxID=13333 RepID=W1NZ90_AMBTC|nr:hypothetical protein AMTR_s00135p00094680 [Amborella trichopoda]
MADKNKNQMSATDHAIRLDLIISVHGLPQAEVYFKNLKDDASRKAACLPLLHCYAKAKDTENAEAFMSKLQGWGLALNPALYNEMMKLYMATGRYRKVLLVIRQMKRTMTPLNILSYNLWMNACGMIAGPPAARRVYEEMVNDENVNAGWSSYATMANIYVKAGDTLKAMEALKSAEQKLSNKNRLGYFLLITLYASLSNKEGVLRLWELSKRVKGRISCTNYMCVMLCLVKVGDIGEAEKVFKEWESKCRKYDVRVSNVLLGAYVRKGWMDKAEALHQHTLRKGAIPNFKTWEILTEGWVDRNEMDKAVEAMEKGLSRLKGCKWRPSNSILAAIAEYFEKRGSIEDTERYVNTLRHYGLVNISVYKSLLRVYVQARMVTLDIVKLMESDQIKFDKESLDLIRESRSYASPE